MFWFDNKELCTILIFNGGEYEVVFFWDVMCINYVSLNCLSVSNLNHIPEY